MPYEDIIETIRKNLRYNYDNCHGTFDPHEYGKGYWNSNERFAKEPMLDGIYGYWFRKCKHCGQVDRWRIIFKYFWVSNYDEDDEIKIIERAFKKEGKHR